MKKTADILLSRDAFREGVFARDGHKCVFCEKPAVDAHHLLERRLWVDGGYYLNNGASVCEEHHKLCEMTKISVEDVRFAAGIKSVIVPEELYPDHVHDKWGNPILEDGRRARGPLFYDESVQKILNAGGVMELFTHFVKYPRTMHLPWSQGMHSDDKMLQNCNHFEGKEVVVSVKWDGENTTMYTDHIHARSIDSKNHASRNWVKGFWGSICGDIPVGWRICGENLFAKHSIEYANLESYFTGFSIWNDRNRRLDWDEMLEWFKLLNIVPPTELYRGVYDEKKIRALWSDSLYDTMEGYVMTTVEGFDYKDFHERAAKFVRKNHVQTVQHWRHAKLIPNKLR
jgi:hypothetical protein